jgi:hypothetical protein
VKQKVEMTVGHVPVAGSTRMLTVGPEHPVWGSARSDFEDFLDPDLAWVRIDPPPGTSDEEVARVRAIFVDDARELGVKTIATKRADVVAPAWVTRDIANAAQSLRGVVEEMLSAVRSEDAAALGEVVQRAMREEGL